MTRFRTVAVGAATAVAFAIAVAPTAAMAAPTAPGDQTAPALDVAKTATFTASGTELDDPGRLAVSAPRR